MDFFLAVNISCGQKLHFNFLPFKAYTLENAFPTNNYIPGKHDVLCWSKDVAEFCSPLPASVLTRSALKPVSSNAAWTTSSWKGRRRFLGLPCDWWLEEHLDGSEELVLHSCCPSWWVLGRAGQGRAAIQLCPLPSQPAGLYCHGGNWGLPIRANTIFHMAFWTGTLVISPRKWRKHKSEVPLQIRMPAHQLVG